MQGSSRLISIVRRPQELAALLSVAVPASGGAPAFKVESAGFNALTHGLYPSKQQLRESWNCLSAARVADEQTLFHVLIVLLETVPALASEAPPTPLPDSWGAETAASHATQAHPRGFRGTKYGPPKSQRMAPLDVRPYLCDSGALNRLMAPLWKFFPAVRKRLASVGYSSEALDSLESSLGPRFWALRPSFVQHIWTFIRIRPRHEVSKYSALYLTLDLDREPQLLWAFTRLLALSRDQPDRAYEWGKIVAALPRERRRVFLEKLIETKAYTTKSGPDAAQQVETMCGLAPDEHFARWAQVLLQNWDAGEYLSAGFRLAAQFQPDYRFDHIGRCPDFAEQHVEEIAISVLEESHGGWFAMALWSRCGQFPGFAETIRKSAWRHFTNRAKYEYFSCLQSFGYDDLPERKRSKKWDAIQQQVPQVEALLLRTQPDYQMKVIGYLADWLWVWDEPVAIRSRMQRSYELLPRLAGPPFSKDSAGDSALCWLIETASEEEWKRIKNASDASFAALERACRRENDARLVGRGFESLTKVLPRFTVDAFCAAPKKLAKAAAVLGGVSFPVRREILGKCRALPLFKLDPFQVPVKDACAIVEDGLRLPSTNPIPKGLSAWVRGEIELSDVRIERYRRVMAEGLLPAQLGLIEQFVIDRLKRGLPTCQVAKPQKHALRLLGSVRENRKGLRKFLKAYWEGDQGYIARHPATIAWYKKHAAVRQEIWEQGIVVPSEDGQVLIAAEADPFEILKLGTYTGTCLGIGGICSDSAVAALIDVNKRVLYARDRKGNVLARQLVAISNDDRLVCFSVYPLSAKATIKALFRDYDHEFASALGLPLYEGSGPCETFYEVDNILSVYWWDESEWDFKIDDSVDLAN